MAAALLLGACAPADDAGPASTLETTTTEPAASGTSEATSLPPPDTTRPRRGSTSTTAPPGALAESVLAQFGEFGPTLPIGAATGLNAGSGCAVEGDQVPDGYWFGHILEYQIEPDPGTVAFDLACVELDGAQNIVYNQTPRIRNVELTSETKFVFVRDELILTPRSGAAEISERFSERYDAAWGWSLIEDGVLQEFYIPHHWDWHNRTEHAERSAIPELLHPDDPDVYVITAEDGFDGSGCSPQGDALPDGLWYGKPSFVAPDRITLDLWCSVSDGDQMIRVGIDRMDVEDRTAIDDGDDAQYPLSASDAVLHLTLIDGNLFQTPLTLSDPRYLHIVNGPETSPSILSGLWVMIKDGVVVEGFNFFHP